MNTKEYNKAVDQYADNLYRFLKAGIGNHQLAEDVLQDSFERLWVNRDKVDNDKVKSFLFTTGYHRLIDVLRKEKRMVPVGEYYDDVVLDSSGYTDTNEILHKALSRLSPIQRTVVLLRDYEGYSYDEIAAITELNESQVKVYIFRALKFLKEVIGKTENVI